MPTVDKRFHSLPSTLAAAALLIGLLAVPTWAADQATANEFTANELTANELAVNELAAKPAATGSAMRANIDPETGKFSTEPSGSEPSPRAALQEELPVAANVVAPGAIDIDVSGLINNYMNVHVTTDGKAKAGCEATPASAEEAGIK